MRSRLPQGCVAVLMAPALVLFMIAGLATAGIGTMVEMVLDRMSRR